MQVKAGRRMVDENSANEWNRVNLLVGMKDRLFVRKIFPCTRQLGSGSGLTVLHIKMWLDRYLDIEGSPLMCIRVGACYNYAFTPQYGTVGCWTATLARKDGTPIRKTIGAVRKLIKEFRAVALDGHEDGTVLLRVVCRHTHTTIKKRIKQA